MTYETITVEQLPNRASNAYHAGDCGIPETPDQFFSVQYQMKDGSYWNGFESEDEQKALAELERYNKMGGVNKIVLVVAKQAEPVEVEQSVEVSEVSIDTAPEKDGAFSEKEMVALALKDKGSHHLDWNQRTKRYEGLVDGKRLCVELDEFSKETDEMQKAAPTDDEYRIWSVATWVHTWIDRVEAGNNPRVYFEEIS